jgi:hypothetical protein
LSKWCTVQPRGLLLFKPIQGKNYTESWLSSISVLQCISCETRLKKQVPCESSNSEHSHILSAETLHSTRTEWEASPPKNLQDCYHTKLVFQSRLYTQPQKYFICNNKHLQICKISRWEILLHEYGFVTDSVKDCLVTKHTHMHCSVISDITVNQHITKTLQNAYHRWVKQQHGQ